MKRFISLLIALVCVFSFLCLTGSGSTAKADKVKVTPQQVINHANALKGTSFTRGYCLGWVATKFWQGLGVPKSTSCCAYNYGRSRIVSTSQNNIPIGADVFFSSSSGKCGTCGNHPGHIGVHVGNGKVVNLIHYSSDPSDKSKVRINTISEILGWGYKFMGWGYHDGVSIVNEFFDISGASFPKNGSTLPKGKGFELKGLISSDDKITHVRGYVYQSVNNSCVMKLGPVDIYPNSNSIQIYTSTINTGLKFGQLPVGTFTLVINAETAKYGEKCFVNTTFNIK